MARVLHSDLLRSRGYELLQQNWTCKIVLSLHFFLFPFLFSSSYIFSLCPSQKPERVERASERASGRRTQSAKEKGTRETIRPPARPTDRPPLDPRGGRDSAGSCAERGPDPAILLIDPSPSLSFRVSSSWEPAVENC